MTKTINQSMRTIQTLTQYIYVLGKGGIVKKKTYK